MLSSRSAVRRLFEEMTDDLDEINLPEIADRVTAAVRENPDLLAAFLDEHLRPMVYEVGFSVLSSQRANERRVESAARQIAAVVMPQTSPPTRVSARLLRRPKREPSGFDWLRQPLAVARGRHMRLEAARRPDLAAAIERQVSRLFPVRQRAMHYALVHAALPDDDQAVGDVLTDAQVGTLWHEAKRRIDAEDRANKLAQKAISKRSGQPSLSTP